jgi:deoxyribodipyrimidine photo-lyase
MMRRPVAGSSVAVAWFRRDLRVHDHPALVKAVEEFGRVVPLFVVDDRLVGSRARPAANRAWFMRGSVAALAASLADLGAPLTVLRGDPATIVPEFAAAVGARAVLASRDRAPYGRRRDVLVEQMLTSRGIAFMAEPGLLVHEPEAVRRSDGGGFTVFSPFLRAWQALERRPVLASPHRIAGVRHSFAAGATIEDHLGAIAPTADPALLPEPGEEAARERLAAWSHSPGLPAYADGRDRLGRDGTSRLSQDLRWGLLSPVEVVERTFGDDAGRLRFRSEIGWRDFYAHLLWHQPRLAREALRPEFEHIAWVDDERVAQAWREGRTGVPVVDAAMRQLLASGWMHNRARMLVAGYLTKHLGIDWRIGAAHFMDHLVDADVASNTGGWQWAASTGADAQPWFRMFNPTLQARRHDPDGDYVRRWVPELAARTDLPGSLVHEPPPGAYLAPMVNHADARRHALARYREAVGSRPGNLGDAAQ